MKNEYIKKWIFKIVLFSAIFFILWLMIPSGGIAMYYIMIFGAAFWFFHKYQTNKVLAKNALKLGVFLMVFDWFVENIGKVLNLWESTNSFQFIGAVPIEIMLLATIGGAAWALHFPEKFDWNYIAVDAIIFAFFGMTGERLLLANSQMIYGAGWTSLHAFIGYFLAFIIIGLVWYKVILKNKKR